MATYAYTFQSGDTLTPTKLNDARTVSDIVNADIKSDAAIAFSKLATGALPSAITVATANITDANVTTAKIADANVTAAKLASNAVETAKIADATSTTTGVTNSKLRHSAALSVIGRTSNTDGAPADIAAATDGHVLRRSGTSIGFGTLAAGAIADASITAAKLDGVAKNSSGTNLSVGTAPTFGCRAFAVFNNSGTISSAGNVSSVSAVQFQENRFTITFATAMPDANYAVCITVSRLNDTELYVGRLISASASSCTIEATLVSNESQDPTDYRVAFFR
jgi:hypothetical protein